jgi:hypothetical protein
MQRVQIRADVDIIHALMTFQGRTNGSVEGSAAISRNNVIAHPVKATRTIWRAGIRPENATTTNVALSMNCPTRVDRTKRQN